MLELFIPCNSEVIRFSPVVFVCVCVSRCFYGRFNHEVLVPHSQFFSCTLVEMFGCASCVSRTHDVIDDVTRSQSKSNLKFPQVCCFLLYKYCRNLWFRGYLPDLLKFRYCFCFKNYIYIYIFIFCVCVGGGGGGGGGFMTVSAAQIRCRRRWKLLLMINVTLFIHHFTHLSKRLSTSFMYRSWRVFSIYVQTIHLLSPTGGH